MTMDPWVQYDDNGDGSAEFCVSLDAEDHKFSASAEHGDAIVEYEETLSERGQIRVSEPPESVFKTLLQSDEMTAFIEQYGLTSAKRIKH